jgi:membrane protease YdiL (CAAX protease family)
VAVFYAIALGLAIVVALLAPVIGEASLLLTMFTPALAVAVMLGILAPEGGARAALAGLGLTRAGWKGWPLAIGAPFLIFGLGLVLLVGAGLATLATPALAGPVALVALKLGIGLIITTLLALLEEVGWRGYMLPRMTGLGVGTAMLAVGFLHGVWHLPLMLLTDFYHVGDMRIVAPLFLITLTLAGVFYGFLRLWTGSVWPVAVAHAAANTAWAAVGALSVPRSPLASEYVGGESGLIVIAGLALVAVPILRFMRQRGMA